MLTHLPVPLCSIPASTGRNTDGALQQWDQKLFFFRVNFQKWS